MAVTERIIRPLHHKPKDIRVQCARDKSLTHRALMFSALANGQSQIHFPLLGADCRNTIACLASFGVEFKVNEDSITVLSNGWQEFSKTPLTLDCGNSGTTARLLTGLLASLPGITCTLAGDESLSSRPMERVVLPLRQMGATISGENDGRTLPIKISGNLLLPQHHKITKASAQVKSAILLAGLNIQGTTTVELPAGSRDHTENILRQLGADCQSRQDKGIEYLSLTGPFQPKAFDYHIPVDPSSAAFFTVFGLLRKSHSTTIKDLLDNPTRTGYLRVLTKMTEQIKLSPAKDAKVFIEPTMTLEVEGSYPLRGVEISSDEVPTLVDEIPILAILAAFAKSPSVFRGLGELRVKESDRLSKTLELLTLAGCESQVKGDDLFIAGGLSQSNTFTYDSLGDHRLAMAAAVLAKFSVGPCRILDADCVKVSFPNFYEELERFEP